MGVQFGLSAQVEAKVEVVVVEFELVLHPCNISKQKRNSVKYTRAPFGPIASLVATSSTDKNARTSMGTRYGVRGTEYLKSSAAGAGLNYPHARLWNTTLSAFYVCGN
jgi:hypothetical protein